MWVMRYAGSVPVVLDEAEPFDCYCERLEGDKNLNSTFREKYFCTLKPAQDRLREESLLSAQNSIS